jgi:secondary thiamine-phosphate synthase enzyme
MECWSTAPIWNCTPHARGWECFQGDFVLGSYPGPKPWAMLYCHFMPKGRFPPFHTFTPSPSRRFADFAPSPLHRIALSPFRRYANLPHPMKSYRKELWFETKKRREFIRITPQVNECLRESRITDGLALVNAMHITASVFINDNESGLHRDFEAWLEKLAPEKPYDQYAHNGAEDNADAHLKRTIMGREVVVAVTEGKLDFGPWEEIFYGEFDGKRRKRVLVKIIGE